jgi:hypothetical protein
MKKFNMLLLIAALAAMSAACGSSASNASANSGNAAKANTANSTTTANTAAPAAAAPTKDSIAALEKSGWEAWKNRDGKVQQELLSDKYVGFNATGRTDKAASVQSMTAQNCKVNSYSWSDEQMKMIGSDVAVLTFKAEQDYTCDGKKGDTPTWSATVYVREGDKWKNVFYAETKVVDANAPPAKAKTGEAKAPDAKPDDLTTTLMAIETKGWDAWKTRDVKGVEDVMAKDFMYFSGKGRLERADAIKGWSEPKCTGLGYTFGEPKAVQLSSDATLVTYKANVTGTCDGVGVAPTLWVASFDVKEGDAWKNAFYMDLSR